MTSKAPQALGLEGIQDQLFPQSSALPAHPHPPRSPKVTGTLRGRIPGHSIPFPSPPGDQAGRRIWVAAAGVTVGQIGDSPLPWLSSGRQPYPLELRLPICKMGAIDVRQNSHILE